MTQFRTTTRAVRAGIDRDAAFGAVTPPIVLSSNFSFDGFGGKRPYDYSRSGNPTRDLLGEVLAELEGGIGAIVTASGLAAITLVLQAYLERDQRIIVPHDCYGGSWRLFKALALKTGFVVDTVDFGDDNAFDAALAKGPRIVWIETPSNPLLRITDVAASAKKARTVGALVVADNTFLSPSLQRPIALGCDIVVHSTTKYLNGHSDVVGGAVVASTAEQVETLGWWANALGLTGAPFDSFLTLRGLRTLDARIRLHEQNARAVAVQLVAHPAVGKVHYPGLVDHPGHAIAKAQQTGFGGMVSLELRGGETAVRAFLDGLRLFTLAESLGGVESLVAHPATMTHAAMDADAQQAAGITVGLLRLSVGIEAFEDLSADLAKALERAAACTSRELAA
nr:cystathionine gamma-synthase [uncultured Sphingomonas sp.]